MNTIYNYSNYSIGFIKQQTSLGLTSYPHSKMGHSEFRQCMVQKGNGFAAWLGKGALFLSPDLGLHLISSNRQAPKEIMAVEEGDCSIYC